MHPQFDYYTYENDLALIKVFPPLCFDKWVDKFDVTNSPSSFIGSKFDFELSIIYLQGKVVPYQCNDIK